MNDTNKQVEKLIDDIKIYADDLYKAKEIAKKGRQNFRTEAIKSAFENLNYPVNSLKKFLK